MRNRELTIKRVEQIEGKLKTLQFMVQRGGNITDFIQEIKKTEDILSDLKSIIEREPFSSNEINKIQ
jgi:DNA-binding FrmR family transcriptional regulator